VLDGELIRLNPNPQLGAKIAVLYTAWMLVGFNRVHPIAGMPGRIVKEPYARTVRACSTAATPAIKVISALPGTIDGLLTPYGVHLLQAPHRGLRRRAAQRGQRLHRLGPEDAERSRSGCKLRQPRRARPSTPTPSTARRGSPAQGLRVPAVNLGTPDYQGSRHLARTSRAPPGSPAGSSG